MDTDFWVKACNASFSRPVEELRQRNDTAYGVAVSCLALPGGWPPHVPCSRRPQIFVFVISAVASMALFLLDYRLLRWRRSGKEMVGDRIWNDLRLFSGWMCAGCVAGVAAFSGWMQWREFEYESVDLRIPQRARHQLQAASLRCHVVFHVFYPIHLLCVIFTLNTLLRRVSDHASHSYYNTARDFNRISIDDRGKRFDFRDCVGQYALYYWTRSMHVIAMLLCSMHVVARMVAAGFTAEHAKLFDQASEGNDTIDLRAEVSEMISRAISACRVLEAAALLLVVSGFLLFFPPIIVMFSRVEQKLSSLLREMQLRSDQGNVFLPFEFSPRSTDGSESQTEMHIVDARKYLSDIQRSASAQRRRFFGCLVFATTALVFLAAFALLSAIVNTRAVLNSKCGKCDPACQNTYDMILIWIRFTPELFPLVAPLCSTLPLLLSLCLMTTAEDRAMLMHPNRFLTGQLSLDRTELEVNLKAERIRMGIDLQ